MSLPSGSGGIILGGLISAATSLGVALYNQARERRKVAIGNAQKIFTEILVPNLFHPLLSERALYSITPGYNFKHGNIYKLLMEHIAYFPMLKSSTSDTLEQLLIVTKNYSGAPSEKENIKELLDALYLDIRLEFSVFRGESILWQMVRSEAME